MHHDPEPRLLVIKVSTPKSPDSTCQPAPSVYQSILERPQSYGDFASQSEQIFC